MIELPATDATIVIEFGGQPIVIDIGENAKDAALSAAQAAASVAAAAILADQVEDALDQVETVAGAFEADALNLVDEVAYVATSPISLTGPQTIGGLTPVAGDRILVAAQADPTKNGIYIYTPSGAWPRASDFDSSGDVVANAYVPVRYGEAGAFVLKSATPLTMDTSPIVWGRYRRDAFDAPTNATLDVTVGPGGQYDQIPAALLFLTRLFGRGRQGMKFRIVLKAGFVMNEQVLVQNADFSWVEIVHETPGTTVEITGSAMTATVGGAIIGKPCFAAVNGKLPRISVLFNVNRTGAASDINGISLDKGAFVYVSNGCGVTNAPREGFGLYDRSCGVANAAIFDNSGTFGCNVDASDLVAQAISLQNCNDGALVSRGAIVHFADANFSGATGAAGNGNGLLATQGAMVNAQVSIADNCFAAGFRGRGASVMNLTNAKARNCGAEAIYADRGVTINADNSDDTNVFEGSNAGGARVLLATGGATLNLGKCTLTGYVQLEGAGTTVAMKQSIVNYYNTAAGTASLIVNQSATVEINGSVITAYGAGRPAIRVTDGGIVNAGLQSTTPTQLIHDPSTGGGSIQLDRGGRLQGYGIIARGGSGAVGILVDESSEMDCPGLDFSINNGRGMDVTQGSRVSIPNSVATVIAGAQVAVNGTGGAIIQGHGTTWACNLTPNTVSANGILFR